MGTSLEDILSLAVSVVALVISIMTLPTVFQMIWGRPEIRLIPHLHHADSAVVLRCYIKNDHIKSKFLKYFGVTRSDVGVECDFSIFESGTKRQIANRVRPLIYGEEDSLKNGTKHVRILPMISSHRIIVLFHDERGAIVWDDNEDEQVLVLDPGSYVARISIVLSTGRIVVSDASFFVGQTAKGTYWGSY